VQCPEEQMVAESNEVLELRNLIINVSPVPLGRRVPMTSMWSGLWPRWSMEKMHNNPPARPAMT